MVNYVYTDIGNLTSQVKSTQSAFKLLGKVMYTQTLTSKKGNDYQLVVFADNSGVKLIINCTPDKLDLNQNYELLIKATKKNNYAMSIFLDHARTSASMDVVNPIVDPESQWLNEHLIIKDLILKTITPTARPDDLFTNLNRNLDTYVGEEVETSSPEDQDLLLKLEDEYGLTYYYRLWANDESLDPKELLIDSVIRFEHVALNKLKGSSSVRNIVKTGLTSLSILE